MRLVLFVLPLGLDTFAVAAALGLRRLPRRERLRVGLVMAAFEAAMPVVGLLLGRLLGAALGGGARWCAVALLAGVGLWLVFGPEEDAPEPGVHGFALVALVLSISLDELAMGFSIGLLRLSLTLAVVLIAVQAFAVSQLGLALGARVGERVREAAERLAGVALVGLAVLFALT